MDDQMRAHQAQLLLDNQVFQECCEEINKSLNREMDKVKNDKELALSLIRDRQSINKVINYIYSACESNKVTEFNARKKRKLF